MAKQVIGNLKLRIPAGRATAGPPVGSTLGQWGLNMMDFINPFNDATKELQGKDNCIISESYGIVNRWENANEKMDSVGVKLYQLTDILEITKILFEEHLIDEEILEKIKKQIDQAS